VFDGTPLSLLLQPEEAFSINNSARQKLIDQFDINLHTLSSFFRVNIMNAIHAGITIGVAELRASPTRILKRAEDEDQAVAILNHNKPAGYIVSPKLMDAMLDAIADRVAENRARERLPTLNHARRVTLDDL
jgi:antitoxin StbD